MLTLVPSPIKQLTVSALILLREFLSLPATARGPKVDLSIAIAIDSARAGVRLLGAGGLEGLVCEGGLGELRRGVRSFHHDLVFFWGVVVILRG